MEDHSGPSSETESLAIRSAAALRELEERAHASLAANRDYVAQLEAEITDQLEQVAAALQSASTAESREKAEAERSAAEIDRLNAELESSRAAWGAERSALEAARDEAAARASQLEGERNAIKNQWQTQLAEFEERLGQQKTTWSQQGDSWSNERQGLERERDEVRQKFELALEDVQRLRGRVAELEQELARRPEAQEADSAELVALRAERDALAERVEALERQPAAAADPSSEQQLADLQRRFELAVEDVRELKTKNARLESDLAKAKKANSASSPVSDAGGMDWESQKRRLLASLEDGGDEPQDPVRQQERLSIESTIEITDAVVAEKDQEIAELKTRLAEGGAAAAAASEQNQRINELVDADEIIVDHRRRIAELEREMEDKLRAAELELSVERAKLARQKAELEDLKSELDSRSSAGGGDGAGMPGVPRRRWLSKLGLSGEEQG